MNKFSYLLLFFFILNLAKADDLHLEFYVSCHKEFEKKFPDSINQNKVSELIFCYKNNYSNSTTPALDKIVYYLGLETYFKYFAQEQNLTSEQKDFFDKCAEEKSKFDLQIGKLAKASYDISFIDKKKPTLASIDGNPPKDFNVSKFYGNNPDECYQSGFKAALFEPANGDYFVFAITGTEGSKTYSNGLEREKYQSHSKGGILGGFLGSKSKQGELISANDKDKEDWGMPSGKIQLSTTCAKEMMEDAYQKAKQTNKKIIFTGHSLGGAIAEVMSYKVEERLTNEKIEHQNIKGITFMSAGGRGHLGKTNSVIEEKLDLINYASLGDIVSNTGSHIGEIREMVRNDLTESKFKMGELNMLETHTLDFNRFKELKYSIHVTGQELGQRFMDYSKSLSNPN